jgi:hypothetical protein
MDIRICFLTAVLVAAPAATAGNIASCDALGEEARNANLDLDRTVIRVAGDELVLRAAGDELVRIDRERHLFVAKREVAVPSDARHHLEAYVAGFQRLERETDEIARLGSRTGARAMTGLVWVLFTSATAEVLERSLERDGRELGARADLLCRTVADLRRTESELQQRIPAFPAFLVPVAPAF